MFKVAIVTGSNKGIGYAIVKSLARQFNGIIYLTARNAELGEAAVDELKQSGIDGSKIHFHQLDIDNKESINRFASYIKAKYGGIDILVNNAAIAFSAAEKIPTDIQAEKSVQTNFINTINLCYALFPLLKPHARVVNVSSGTSQLKFVKNDEIRSKLTDENSSVEDIMNIALDYIKKAKEQTLEENGYPTSGYVMSKILLTSVSRVQQRLFLADQTREDIIVNACCPGYCATDMTASKGFFSPEEGAITPVYLALLPENVNEPKGELVIEKRIIKWA